MKLLLGILTVIAMGAMSPARAAVVLIFEYSGVVTTLDYNAGLFGAPGTVSIGDTFSGTFSYVVGASNPDQAAADPELGGYEGESFTLAGTFLTLDPLIVVVEHRAPLPTLPPLPPDTGEDRFSMFVSLPVGPYASGVSFTLSGEFDDAFMDDSLPLDLDLADFMIMTLTASGPTSILMGQPTLVDRGDITALMLVSATEIPLPAALYIFLAGLAGLGGAMRRRIA